MSCVACNLFWKIPNVRSQNPNQIHKNPKQNRKIQNRITKPYRCPLLNKVSIYLSIYQSIYLKQNHKTKNRIAKFETESQNSKQNHKTQGKIKKTQNRIAKPKTKFKKIKTGSQNRKQKHKTQNRNVTKTQNGNTKPKTEIQKR